MSLLEDSCSKVRLQQRLATAARHTTAARPQVGGHAAELCCNILAARLLAAAAVPCIRVAAELAAHGTPLQQGNNTKHVLIIQSSRDKCCAAQSSQLVTLCKLKSRNDLICMCSEMTHMQLLTVHKTAAAATHLCEHNEAHAWTVNS
jgi:hypothetical protein